MHLVELIFEHVGLLELSSIGIPSSAFPGSVAAIVVGVWASFAVLKFGKATGIIESPLMKTVRG